MNCTCTINHVPPIGGAFKEKGANLEGGIVKVRSCRGSVWGGGGVSMGGGTPRTHNC